MRKAMAEAYAARHGLTMSCWEILLNGSLRSLRIALCLIARSARCDVRWVPPSSSDLAERKSVVPPSPPADRRPEHREAAYFARRRNACPLTPSQLGGARSGVEWLAQWMLIPGGQK